MSLERSASSNLLDNTDETAEQDQTIKESSPGRQSTITLGVEPKFDVSDDGSRSKGRGRVGC